MFELESSNYAQVVQFIFARELPFSRFNAPILLRGLAININRSPDKAFVRFFLPKTNKKQLRDEDFDFEQQCRSRAL